MAKDETRNEVVPIFGGDLVDVEKSEALIAAMEDTADEGGRRGDVSYMSFSGKRGVYKIGQDGRSPGEDEPFLVAVTQFELGWIAWRGKKPVAKRMALITQPKVQQPMQDEGGPFDENKGEGWHRARAITVKSLENGEQCYFANNSKSGVAVMSDLQHEVLDRMKSGQPFRPVITFGVEEFTAQDFTNYKPVFDVVKWLDDDDIQVLLDPDADPMSVLDDQSPQKEVPAPRTRRRL